MDRPLRLITAGPVDRVAMTLEALLVVASQPLSVANAAIELAVTFGVSMVPATRTVAFDDPLTPPSEVISQV